MASEYLGVGLDDGTILGRGATDKIAFYGTTPAVQPSLITACATTAATTATPYGYTTSTQADAIVTSLNAVIAALKTLGLVAST